ncbi:hypothetical protein BLOT_012533 [Blomia tropicalis]|nr:hypothetical protein BLOT_012533 [Blomia tropicalis]
MAIQLQALWDKNENKNNFTKIKQESLKDTNRQGQTSIWHWFRLEDSLLDEDVKAKHPNMCKYNMPNLDNAITLFVMGFRSFIHDRNNWIDQAEMNNDHH